jgi:hypothetical protein
MLPNEGAFFITELVNLFFEEEQTIHTKHPIRYFRQPYFRQPQC